MTEQRQRADRIDEEAEQRRRRLEGTIDASAGLKLAIPQEVQERLDAEGRVGRWVKADPTRQYAVTRQNEYRPVDGVDPIATKDMEGEPIKLMLMSKRKDFIEDDVRRREETRIAKEDAAFDSAALGPNQYQTSSHRIGRRGS